VIISPSHPVHRRYAQRESPSNIQFPARRIGNVRRESDIPYSNRRRMDLFTGAQVNIGCGPR
jgi:hypothetical protein